MGKFRWMLLLTLVLGLFCNKAMATEIGDPAPSLDIRKWVKGDSVDLKKGKGKSIFVVEFWATWCLPCRETIPHLTKLQKKYKDQGVVIIGVTDEGMKKVGPFISKKGNAMDYVVAIDDENKTTDAYLKAFGIKAIPYAFVVDREGNIAWAGHPLDGLDRVLGELVADRYDLKGKVRSARAEKLLPVYFYMAAKTQEHDLAKQVGERIFQYGKDNVDLLNVLAWKIITLKEIEKRDFELASRAVDRAYTLCEGKSDSVLDTYALVLFARGQTGKAIEFQKRAVAINDKEEAYKKRLEAYRKHQTRAGTGSL